MASEAVGTQVKIRLSYFDAAGYQSRLEQLCTGSVTVPVCHFLADDEIDGPLSVVGHRDPRHSHACLCMPGYALHNLNLLVDTYHRRIRKYCYLVCL